MTHPKVLVIEDDPVVARALRRALGTKSIDCDVAATVAEVRKAAGNYQIAVVDVNLPDGNGIDLYDELRASSRVCSGIFFTATENEADRARASISGTLISKSEGVHAAVSRVVQSLASL